MDEMQRDVNVQVADVQFQLTGGMAGVSMSGWKYLGRGLYKNIDGSSEKSGITFLECLKWCEDKRAGYKSWNGVLWDPRDKDCECLKNDRGHRCRGYTNYMHFRM